MSDSVRIDLRGAKAAYIELLARRRAGRPAIAELAVEAPLVVQARSIWSTLGMVDEARDTRWALCDCHCFIMIHLIG